jgi:hypothetical protein
MGAVDALLFLLEGTSANLEVRIDLQQVNAARRFDEPTTPNCGLLRIDAAPLPSS